jgi:GTP cyclohydrolase II
VDDAAARALFRFRRNPSRTFPSKDAIKIRRVQFSVNAVPVRLHCRTGKVFGSRRCDCGDLLRLAPALLEELGGGIILYLAQEAGRLGLANKMRTYQPQDDGLEHHTWLR